MTKRFSGQKQEEMQSEFIPMSSFFEIGTNLRFSDLFFPENEFRYELHKTSGRQYTGYDDIIVDVFESPKDIYFRIGPLFEPITRSLGEYKSISRDFALSFVREAILTDWFGAVYQMDFHHIEVKINSNAKTKK